MIYQINHRFYMVSLIFIPQQEESKWEDYTIL